MNDRALQPAEFVPGLFPAMPASVYHGIEAMSASGAKKMLRSPQHYKLMRTQASTPTAAMEFGTVVHAGVLEPETLNDCVAVMPPGINKRTKEGKAVLERFVADNPGKILLDGDDWFRAEACIKAVREHPAAAKLLDGGERELSLFWNDRKHGVPCKSRLDAFNHGGVIDLKTTQDASPEQFARQIASYLYHMQGAFYCSAAEHVMGEAPAFFAFIAVESEPPHAVACYVLPSNAIMAGAHLCSIALTRYAHALATGEWPGYSETIDVITLPAWATKFNA